MFNQRGPDRGAQGRTRQANPDSITTGIKAGKEACEAFPPAMREEVQQPKDLAIDAAGNVYSATPHLGQRKATFAVPFGVVVRNV